MSAMCPDQQDQRGVGTIAAVFLIVVLGMLGTALVALVATEQRATSREMASAQAFYAAETALQWGMYQVVHKTGSGNFPNDGRPIFNGAPPHGLGSCGNATRTGQAAPVRFAANVPAIGGALDLFRFEAVGVCHPGSPVETRRRLEVRFNG